MPGQLMRLIYYAAQDEYLTNKPQLTFFNTSYKRHADFVIESIIYYKTYKSNEIIICPISQDIAIYPIITLCHHIFDKENLEDWLNNHNNCPLCRQELYIMI